MFAIDTGTARDYHELNAGAHRKPPKVLSAPSLIWHLAFWTNFPELGPNGKPLANGDGSPRKKTPEEIKRAVDRYIVALCKAVIANEQVGREPGADQENAGLGAKAGIDGRDAGVQLTPKISGAHLLFGNAYGEHAFEPVADSALGSRQRDILESTTRTVTLQFVWRQLDVTIRFEIRTEYFTMSTFVELDRHHVKVLNHREFSSIPELNDRIADILHYLNAGHPASGPVAKPQPAGDSRSIEADGSHPPQPDAAPVAIAPVPGGEQLVEGINKYCFHEFWKTYQQEVLSDKSLDEYTHDATFRNIIADFRGFIASDQAVSFPDSFFKGDKPPNWGLPAKIKFLPLIQHRIQTEHSRYECAVNYILDGRALYMSTLGPQLPSIPDGERIPVEFIVYARQRFNDTTVVNKWQLGRLVSQILQVDTLRLCALKDIKSLREAGEQLGLLEQRTQAARDAIASTEASAGTPNDEPVMNLIGVAHKKLNEITGAFLDTGSGLSFRIERSRYYVEQFEDNVKLLRIKRLEGDQPYDQFIRRRLGSEFDFIDRLGARYERATTNVASLDQNYLAITQNALVKQANKIDEDIHKIQKYGEFLLLAVLVPYYFAHLTLLICGEEYSVTVAANIWFAFFLVAIANFYELPRRLKHWRLPAIFAGTALLVLLGFALLVPLEVMLRNRQQDRYNQKQDESVDREVRVLKELLEAKRAPGEGSKAAPPVEHEQATPPPKSVVPPVTSAPTTAPVALPPATR